MWRVVPILLAVPVLVVPLTGCGSSHGVSVPRRSQGLIVGSQGAGSEVVFHGVAVSGADELAGAEYARRDESLNIRAAATAFDADAWPAAPVPALDDWRFLHIPQDPRTVVYFNTTYPRRSYYRGDSLYFYWRSWE